MQERLNEPTSAREFIHDNLGHIRFEKKADTLTVWDGIPPSAENIRLLTFDKGWVMSKDELNGDGSLANPGSGGRIESAFLNALNSSNLMVLTGAGASFSASNATGNQAPGMNDLWNCVQQQVGPTKFAEILALFPTAPIAKNIEKLLTLCKIYLELNEGSSSKDFALVTDFVALAEIVILQRVDFVTKATKLAEHMAFVRKIGRRGIRKSRTKLFTTNYDLCFEEAARRQRFTVLDGFSHSLDQTYDRSNFDTDIVRRANSKEGPDYIENVFHLYKLHGSLDWRRFDAEIVRSKSDDGKPVLIYPRSSKYQEAFEPPYLDMIGSFQTALREPDTAVIVSGFGFNDDHLSRPVLSALEANMSLRLIICDPSFVWSNDALPTGPHSIAASPLTNPFFSRFQTLALSGDPRIHLMNGRFGDLSMALPDLVGETDRERHAMRIRNAMTGVSA